MPFDGTIPAQWTQAVSTAAQTVFVLDMVEFFFRDGARWAPGSWHTAGGRRCLLDAVRFIPSEICCDVDRENGSEEK
jgi:hypothetical protein